MSPKDKLDHLPDKPGAYIFKDKKGRVLYVGKALSLKKRVRSYFGEVSFSPRTELLLSQLADLESIVTDSETEAYLLEYNLIKRYRPRYNIRLRDDKSYPYIKLTTNEDFPKVFLTRNPRTDEAQYFGPYTNVKAARRALHLIHRLFPLRRCKSRFKPKIRPCMNYHIKECTAPCVDKISRKDYLSLVKGVSLFLQGRHKKLLFQLKQNMEEASRKERFERAANLRDCIEAIERIGQTQKVSSFPGQDKDLIGIVSEGEEACGMVFLIREGKLMDKKHFLLKIAPRAGEKDILISFLKQYYAEASFIPPEILLQRPLHEEAAIIRWLSLRRKGRVNLAVPRRGEKLKFMKLVERNAYMMLKQERGEEKAKALLQLKAYLSLKEKPLRIEGFDISNIHGRHPTGSVVVFEEGKRKKSGYRRFKIKRVEGIDDCAMLSEVVDRRCRRIIKEKGTFPHLILVDGGKGQVSSCLKVLKSLGLNDLPLIGLAKELEEVYVSGKSLPLNIPQNSAALKLLQEIRDEAHRFAHTFHIQSREKRLKASSLDEIPGIGRETRKLLLTHFKSVDQIKNKSWKKLAEIPGIGEKKARKILDYLSSKIDSPSC